MQLAWLETLKKFPRMPAAIERRMVADARRAIQPVSDGVPGEGERTLWVDISVISRRDAGSGIQRVVRALLAELQEISIAGWRVQPVAATPRQPYRAVAWEIPAVNPENHPKMEPQPGDVFLGLDLSAHIIPRHHAQFLAWKKRGLTVAFVVYDLLPLHYPEWFSAKLVRAFRRWTKSLAILADSVFCISQPVRDDFENLMASRYHLSAGAIPAHVFPMGGNINASQPSTGVPAGFAETLRVIASAQSALMVGTIEPRKGYGQILEAFERLWAQGSAHKLVIVGRPGWMTEALQGRISTSTHLNTRLFWFDNASDEALQALYSCCTGVILASHAEGYGLPLLEALAHGKPVLARDLPVFRQFATPLVSYFAATSSVASIGEAIDQWLLSADAQSQFKQAFPLIELPTWRGSLCSLLAQLLPKAAILTIKVREIA